MASKGDRQSIKSENRREFFIQIPAFLEYLTDLDPFAWRLYAHYIRVCGEQDTCFEYTATTSRLCAMSERTIRYRRQTLVDLNLISLQKEGQRGDERVNVLVRDVWAINAKFLQLVRSKSTGEWVEPWIRAELSTLSPAAKQPLAPDADPPAPDADPPAPDADKERSSNKIPDKDPVDNDKIDLPSIGNPPVTQPESDGRGRRQTDPIFAEICTVYENEIGTFTEMIAQVLGDLVDEHPKDWIIDAIRIAVKNNSRKLSYVSGILDNWKREGRGSSPSNQRKPKNSRAPKGQSTNGTVEQAPAAAVKDDQSEYYKRFGSGKPKAA